MARKKQRGKKKFIHTIVSVEIKIVTVFTIAYLVFSLVLNPQFILSDLKEKFVWAQTVVSVQIPGQPGKPVPAAAGACSNGNASIALQWEATTDTDTYDVYRDSQLLIDAVQETQYSDGAITTGTTYTYQIVAHGPMGDTSSDEVAAAASECSTAPETPAATEVMCQIRRIAGENAIGVVQPTISDRTPKISGTTSIPHATITLVISGKTDASASTTANGNGYWSWTASEKLKYGKYVIEATAVDPSDMTRSASDSAMFHLEEKTASSVSLPVSPVVPREENSPSVPREESQHPISISIQITNKEKTVFSGKDLLATITFRQDGTMRAATMVYTLFDEHDEEIYGVRDTQPLDGTISTFEKNIPVPRLTPIGTYRIEAKAVSDDSFVSAEDFFTVREMPLVSIGSTHITVTDILRNMSAVILWLLIVLMLFLALLLREHLLAQRALFPITETILKEKGFWNKRKGVLK